MLPTGVQAHDGLIQEEDDWVVDQRPSDAESLPHAMAVGADQLRGLRMQPNNVEQRQAVAPCLGSLPPVELREVADVLDPRDLVRQAEGLGQHADRGRIREGCSEPIPSIVNRPEEGRMIVVRIRMDVVLPAPLGPRKPITCPRSSSKDNSPSALPPS